MRVRVAGFAAAILLGSHSRTVHSQRATFLIPCVVDELRGCLEGAMGPR